MSKTTGVKCPHCDAPIEYDGSERYVTCEYCGSKVEVTGENEIVFRKVDEAEVQKTKTERAVKLKELDAQMAEDERDSEHQNRFRYVWVIVVVVCLIAGLFGNEDMFYLAFLAAVIGFFGKSIVKWFQSLDKSAEKYEAEQQKLRDAGYISIPPDLSIQLFPTVKIEAAVEMLKASGFKDIEIVNLRDLTRKDRAKKDIIDKVIINGETAYKNTLYPPDAKVLVQYHGFPSDSEASILKKLGAGVRAAKEVFLNDK